MPGHEVVVDLNQGTGDDRHAHAGLLPAKHRFSRETVSRRARRRAAARHLAEAPDLRASGWTGPYDWRTPSLDERRSIADALADGHEWSHRDDDEHGTDTTIAGFAHLVIDDILGTGIEAYLQWKILLARVRRILDNLTIPVAVDVEPPLLEASTSARRDGRAIGSDVDPPPRLPTVTALTAAPAAPPAAVRAAA